MILILGCRVVLVLRTLRASSKRPAGTSIMPRPQVHRVLAEGLRREPERRPVLREQIVSLFRLIAQCYISFAPATGVDPVAAMSVGTVWVGCAIVL